MSTTEITADLREWVVEQARSGKSPELVLQHMLERGWQEQAAVDAVEEIMRDFLTEHARENALPPPIRVPTPVGLNGPSILQAGDREVQVLANLVYPRVVVFGSLLSHKECDELMELARPRLTRSTVVDNDTGGDQVHEARTSQGMCFVRGENPLCRKIEARLARLLDWPLENGEGLQILRYSVGAEYKPHHDYFDPAQPGSKPILQRGGQRVASLVMYLNTPRSGGCTTFPDVKFEIAAIKGNAAFFTYDRPHPMTKTLHGGAPVIEGEKWIATKWLREAPHV